MYDSYSSGKFCPQTAGSIVVSSSATTSVNCSLPSSLWLKMLMSSAAIPMMIRAPATRNTMNMAVLFMREIRGTCRDWFDPLILFSPPVPVLVAPTGRVGRIGPLLWDGRGRR